MADPKITVPELLPAAALTGAELVPIWQTSGMVRATLAEVVTFAGGLITTMSFDQGGGLVAGGTANALTVTPATGSWAMVDGANIAFRAASANTAAATLNVNGTGARSLVKQTGVALIAGDMQPGAVYDAVYVLSSNHFRLRSGVTGVAPPQVTVRSGVGTYTPPAGTRRLRIRGVGGGGASGTAPATGSGQISGATGGGGGGYFEHDTTTIAASYAYSVGAGGVFGTSNGGDTTFASLTANGGANGVGTGPVTGSGIQPGGAGGGASGANLVNAAGSAGGPSLLNTSTGGVGGGAGGNSVLGGGGGGLTAPGFNGNPGIGPGAGGGGGYSGASTAARTGIPGNAGTIIVEAFF